MVNSNSELTKEIEYLRLQLDEANETIEAIRTGQIDALVVHNKNGHQLYTLKSADQTYRVFIEKMTEGAVTLNAEKIILYSNSRFASMVNRPLSDVIGKSFSSFISEKDQPLFEGLFARGFKEDCKAEILLIGKNRTTVCLMSLTSLELDEGVSLSIILTDLTILKDSEKQLKIKNDELEASNLALELSNTDLQQFAYVASHDLQEPLRKIILYASHLKEKHGAEFPSQSSNFLEKIISSSTRMKSLILDILNYSRLTSDEIVYESCDLNEIINRLIEDFELPIKERKVQIKVGKLPVVEVIPTQIRQVMQNLISNALKFSKSDGPVEIKITGKRVNEKSFTAKEDLSGNYCLIEIKDNGIGFNKKYATQIFTLFERLHSKDKYEGTGIGLAITKKIIDKHNGLIMADSTEGEGTTFSIILPVLQYKLMAD